MTDEASALEDDEAEGRRPRVLSNAQVLRFLAKQWRRRPRLFVGLILFSGVGTGADILLPIAAGALVDSVTGPDARVDGDAHWIALAGFIALAALANIARQVAVRCEIRFSSANMADMTAEAFGKVQRFSADWHANTFAGSVVRKVTRGMWAYDTVTATLWFELVPAVFVLLGLSGYMMARWPWVGVYALVVSILFMAGSIALSTYYIRPQNIRSNAVDSELGGALADAVSGIATVKGFGAEDREEARFRGLTERWRSETQKTWFRFVNSWLLQMAAVLLLQAGLAGLLVGLWTEQKATGGDVAFAMTAFLVMSGYLRRFGDDVRDLQRGLDEMQDVGAYAATPEQISDRPQAPRLRAERGGVVLDSVRFTYPGQVRPLFEDLSVHIAPGERVALVGPTGSGKSTFVKLIQRFYDVDRGAVRVDGQDVREVSKASLRRAVALVPQDPALFHRSIRDNIAYARPDASEAAIHAAAQRARAHDFISRLPAGYDTLVGERGVKLSGGERQRVAIARAILADAPILVFDEATSSLDNATERLVQEALEEVSRSKTTLVIAHRLSTTRSADRILVFKEGRVVEQGTHADLLARKGVYAHLAALAGLDRAPTETLALRA